MIIFALFFPLLILYIKTYLVVSIAIRGAKLGEESDKIVNFFSLQKFLPPFAIFLSASLPLIIKSTVLPAFYLIERKCSTSIREWFFLKSSHLGILLEIPIAFPLDLAVVISIVLHFVQFPVDVLNIRRLYFLDLKLYLT